MLLPWSFLSCSFLRTSDVHLCRKGHKDSFMSSPLSSCVAVPSAGGNGSVTCPLPYPPPRCLRISLYRNMRSRPRLRTYEIAEASLYSLTVGALTGHPDPYLNERPQHLEAWACFQQFVSCIKNFWQFANNSKYNLGLPVEKTCVNR